MGIIDLSHPLHNGMPSYPGLPVSRFSFWRTHDEAARQRVHSGDATYATAYYHLAANTGTYIDAPFHRHENGEDFADLPMERFTNIPGEIIHVGNAGPIGKSVLDGHMIAQRAVLFKTNWSRQWGRADYFERDPYYLLEDTVRELVTSGVTLVGIDCHNVDGTRTAPAHTMLLGAGIPIVEHLCNLEALSDSVFRFFAVPPAIRGGTAFPVRAFALCSK